MEETILLDVKTYTLQQYSDLVAKKHPNTVKKYIKKGLLPSNHHVILGKQFIITVHPRNQKDISNNTELACIEFSKLIRVVEKESAEQKKFKRELAAEICIKYDINTVKFFKMQGL
jgi:hypothetical protein